jgi:hypothetical protein
VIECKPGDVCRSSIASASEGLQWRYDELPVVVWNTAKGGGQAARGYKGTDNVKSPQGYRDTSDRHCPVIRFKDGRVTGSDKVGEAAWSHEPGLQSTSTRAVPHGFS